MSLSRDQELELQVVSYLDLAVALLALVAIVLGLLLIGRRWLAHRIPMLGTRLRSRARVDSGA
jgi:hypothetical protein